MGGKDSKPAFLTYEDAIKRVTNAELKRLKDSFKRYANLNSYMTKAVFIKEVLGDGVPARLAELLYSACSGTHKGLGFKELVCGLVLLTRGRQEEKLKFLFSLYCSPRAGMVQKQDLDALVVATEGNVPAALSSLFKHSDQITFDVFREWVVQHPEVTSLTRWLLKEPCAVTLSNNHETPTFYQTLAGVTHLEEPDIIELEKRYWQLKSQSKTGRFDMETFQMAVSTTVPTAVSQGLFSAFDENFDNHIDFKEMACGISACCRGPFTERLKFCFKVFDCDHDMMLNRAEVLAMAESLLTIHQDNPSNGPLQSGDEDFGSAEDITAHILATHPADPERGVTREEFLVWAISHPLPGRFLDLLFQVAHIVLGLKPQNKHDEEVAVSGWVRREEAGGLCVGQTWYLVSAQWWQQWQAYVSCQDGSPSGDTSPQRPSPGTDPGGGSPLTLKAAHKAHSRSSSLSLCPSLGWRSPPGLEGSGDGEGGPRLADSPVRYTSLPQSPAKNGRTKHNNHSNNKLDGVAAIDISRPGAIDNSPLTTTSPYKVTTLTNEGAHLRKDRPLVRGRDYELMPEPVWKALSAWYGGTPALPRNVIQLSPSCTPDLELYPLVVKLMKHQVVSTRPAQATGFSGVMGGIGGMVVNSTGLNSLSNNLQVAPRRYLAYTAVFSRKHTLRQVYEFLVSRLKVNREELRLWKFPDEQNMVLLEDEQKTMSQLSIDDNTQLLIEVRNKDLTWPEEMSQLAKNKEAFEKKQQVPTERGATGLSNLGNTCFMNSALQCVSNTQILTDYFNGGIHLYEINRTNPLGLKGHLAQRYGELVKDLWNGNSKCIAPLKFRWTIGRYAPRFNGFQQHDSQELLAFLLDGLHEDLNRVHEKPYVELKDSDGRPDSTVAKEAWENHLLRNRSIVVDLFHGQLKSTVRCKHCGNTSVRFDPFTFLSLPLPMESCVHVEVLVVWLSGSVPTKYGIRLNLDERYTELKKELAKRCEVPANQLLLVDISGAVVKSFPEDNHKVRGLVSRSLYAYELPPPPQCTTNNKKSTNPETPTEGLPQIQREYRSSPVKSKSADPPPASRESPVGSVSGVEQGPPPQAEHPAPSAPVIHPPPTPTDSALLNGNNNHTPLVNGASSPNMPLTDFVVAMHRKMMRMDLYFLSSQKSKPSLFGLPLILPCDTHTTKHDLYQLVWTQVSRLVSPLPPSETSNPNHAQDCDDSLGYEYPFGLKAVGSDGMTCAWCPWYRFCRGCKLECNKELFDFGTAYIAVDWEPTALHLRYQTSQERVVTEDASVAESRRQQTEPISLDSCLHAFTQEEELGDQELYYCAKCKDHRRAVKKLDIWKLPPILIIHLKRFQFHNGRWIKSHKIVDVPKVNFDPSSYVVPRIKMSLEMADSDCEEDDEDAPGTMSVGRSSKRHLSTSSETDYTAVKYQLYAMSCHMGILGGGHYIAYAKNPNNNWYCYNDSSCKELPCDQIDYNSAYLLFYETHNLKKSSFVPDVRDRQPDNMDIDDEAESELKKMCSLQ